MIYELPVTGKKFCINFELYAENNLEKFQMLTRIKV